MDSHSPPRRSPGAAAPTEFPPDGGVHVDTLALIRRLTARAQLLRRYRDRLDGPARRAMREMALLAEAQRRAL
jgi:hypothetical protein